MSVSPADLGMHVRYVCVLQQLLLHFTSWLMTRLHARQFSASCDTVRRRKVIASLASNLQVRIPV